MLQNMQVQSCSPWRTNLWVTWIPSLLVHSSPRCFLFICLWPPSGHNSRSCNRIIYTDINVCGKHLGFYYSNIREEMFFFLVSSVLWNKSLINVLFMFADSLLCCCWLVYGETHGLELSTLRDCYSIYYCTSCCIYATG